MQQLSFSLSRAQSELGIKNKKLISINVDWLQEVCTQIWATLYDYPGLKSCDGLIKYIKECVRTAWGLNTQVETISGAILLFLSSE